MKLLRKHESGTHVRYLYTTDLSLSGEEAFRVGDRGPQRDVKAHSSSWRRETLQGYLTIFTINNVVRELVGELNLRSVEAFLRFVERHLGGPPGLMKTFNLR